MDTSTPPVTSDKGAPMARVTRLLRRAGRRQREIPRGFVEGGLGVRALTRQSHLAAIGLFGEHEAERHGRRDPRFVAVGVLDVQSPHGASRYGDALPSEGLGGRAVTRHISARIRRMSHL